MWYNEAIHFTTKTLLCYGLLRTMANLQGISDSKAQKP